MPHKVSERIIETFLDLEANSKPRWFCSSLTILSLRKDRRVSYRTHNIGRKPSKPRKVSFYIPEVDESSEEDSDATIEDLEYQDPMFVLKINMGNLGV